MKSTDDGLPGGKANAKRGELSHELALKFAEAFPIQTSFTAARFDTWLEQIEGIVPPPSTDTVAWKGHVQRRQDYIKRLNAAATHPRMWESDRDTYEIVCVKPEFYEVRQIEISQTAEKQMRGMGSLLETYQRHIKHRMQGIKWDELSPQALGIARHLLYAMSYFAESIEHQSAIHLKLARDLKLYQQSALETRKQPPLLGPAPTETPQEEPQDQDT
jgi:hypothetical protein